MTGNANDVGQATLVINDPSVVREVEAEFAAYYRALAANDIAVLNRFFFDSPDTIRYGNAEVLYGYEEIKAYRSTVTASIAPNPERTVITTFGRDFATASTLHRRSSGKLGRTTQTWVRFPRGWRIVVAHVSTIDQRISEQPGYGHVDEAFDKNVLSILASGKGSKLAEFTPDDLMNSCNGELVNWIITAGVVGDRAGFEQTSPAARLAAATSQNHMRTKMSS